MSVKKTWETRFNPSFLYFFVHPTFHLPIWISPALSLGQKPPCISPVWDPSVCHRSLACCLLHHGGTIFATLHQLRQGTQDHLRIGGAGWILVVTSGQFWLMQEPTTQTAGWFWNEHWNPGWFYIKNFRSNNSIQFVLKDGKIHIHLMCRGTTRLTI